MNNNLTTAFKQLRKAGYFARQNYMCCQSCGWASVPNDKSERAVFYHAQDRQSMLKDGKVYLCWAGNGEEISSILKDNGLSVDWDGNSNRRIMVDLNTSLTQ